MKKSRFERGGIAMIKLTGSIVLGALLLFASEVRADFLGLAPGDYAITLNNSASLCGGSNCTGTVHIGSPGGTGFDWAFTIGTDVFDFDSDSAHQNTSVLGLNSCAFESLGGAGSCQANVTFNSKNIDILSFPHFVLSKDTGGVFWSYGQSPFIAINNGSFSAVAVAEPLSVYLLLSGVGVLALRRRLLE